MGVDISEKMLEKAKNKTNHANVTYIYSSIEDYEYPQNAFDIVISSLAFHYVQSFDNVCEPTPANEMIKQIPAMKDELRRPMMLIIAAKKG